MIHGIGTDIIEVDRIANLCEKEQFLKRVYHINEIAYCKSKKTGQHQSLAARYAAKEAILKALGTGLRGEINLNEIEVTNTKLGKPHFLLHGITRHTFSTYNFKNIHLSLSHLEKIASAYVIIEI